EAFLTRLKTLTDELVKQSETPGSSGVGTVLAEQFFRDTIRRFQWREYEDDGGDVQDEPVSAKDDAVANRLKGAATAASGVNSTRLAHRLGLFGIGERSDLCPPGFAKTRAAGRAIKLRPADSAAREQKATIMDRIAD